MKETWESRIRRAEQLAREMKGSEELLSFYALLLRCQKDIYQRLRAFEGWLPSGELEADLPAVRSSMPGLLKIVAANGPDKLACEARDLLEAPDTARDSVLIRYWRAPSDTQFFAKAIIQPYASWLREIGVKKFDRGLGSGENRCPFCQGNPQASILQIKDSSSESGGRDLICATCLALWPFRRIVCANCGEEDPEKIGYYHSPEYDHIRVEACDTCKYYIKAVDLTRYGLAVPLVDDVASAPLDLWARERGYTRIEMNLVGL
ncbi:MAG TPA: formate dehydrogenase accessory protein FdhE [Blastocatellia bacterium]|nr:formate dehydrogenase accessory protein FdhE [Blastocatellia bacterium]